MTVVFVRVPRQQGKPVQPSELAQGSPMDLCPGTDLGSVSKAEVSIHCPPARVDLSVAPPLDAPGLPVHPGPEPLFRAGSISGSCPHSFEVFCGAHRSLIRLTPASLGLVSCYKHRLSFNIKQLFGFWSDLAGDVARGRVQPGQGVTSGHAGFIS